MGEDADKQSGLPTTNRDQSCAFCGTSRPRFVHRLDPGRVQFRVYGKGWTLPTFWAACERCEGLVINGNDEVLIRLMRYESLDDELRRASLTAFRSADLGWSPLADA